MRDLSAALPFDHKNKKLKEGFAHRNDQAGQSSVPASDYNAWHRVCSSPAAGVFALPHAIAATGLVSCWRLDVAL